MMGASLPHLGIGRDLPSGYLRLGNGEMDEGIEGRSGVTLAGSNSVGLRTRGNPRVV